MFSESLKTGERGEHAVWNLFIKQPWVRNVIDVRNDKDFQEQDIDFLIEDTKRQFTPIEVKTDYVAHKSGKIAYELTTSGNIGCFEKTKARYIVYFIPESETAHVINVIRLRTYIQNERPTEVQMGDAATGFLLPIDKLIQEKVITHTYKGVV